jgi:hypothetical protein
MSIRHLSRFVYSLLYFALFSGVGLTLLKDHEESTRTHCNVFNFLPSASVSMGDFEPQRYIWRFCFALDSIPRYLIAYLQLILVLDRQHIALSVLYPFVQITNSFIHFLELTFLLSLTYISSNENTTIHRTSYIGFMICSVLHMLLTILIDYFWPRTSNFRISDAEKLARSKRLKWFIINIMSFFISIYFYFRHLTFCEPNIYSMYSLFEYFFILTNIAYHCVAFSEWDMEGGQIEFLY